jgi:hypothetical protein
LRWRRGGRRSRRWSWARNAGGHRAGKRRARRDPEPRQIHRLGPVVLASQRHSQLALARELTAQRKEPPSVGVQLDGVAREAESNPGQHARQRHPEVLGHRRLVHLIGSSDDTQALREPFEVGRGDPLVDLADGEVCRVAAGLGNDVELQRKVRRERLWQRDDKLGDGRRLQHGYSVLDYHLQRALQQLDVRGNLPDGRVGKIEQEELLAPRLESGSDGNTGGRLLRVA